MSQATIKFKVKQDPITKNLELQIYRNCGKEKDEWFMVDRFNELTARELKGLADFINSLFVKKEK